MKLHAEDIKGVGSMPPTPPPFGPYYGYLHNKRRIFQQTAFASFLAAHLRMQIFTAGQKYLLVEIEGSFTER